jgi:hypothetical protein
MQRTHASAVFGVGDDGRRAYKGAKFKFEIETAAAGRHDLHFVFCSYFYSVWY